MPITIAKSFTLIQGNTNTFSICFENNCINWKELDALTRKVCGFACLTVNFVWLSFGSCGEVTFRWSLLIFVHTGISFWNEKWILRIELRFLAFDCIPPAKWKTFTDIAQLSFLYSNVSGSYLTEQGLNPAFMKILQDLILDIWHL